MLEREEAKRLEPNGYERGYYDGYHKGYANKKSEVSAVEKKAKEELRQRMATIEISAVYPFSVIYEIIDPENRAMLPPDSLSEVLEGKIVLSSDLINKVLNEKLNDRERRCLEMYRRDDMTLEEIGKKMNVTRERVRQIIAKAERKLRNPRWIREMEAVPYTEYASLSNDHEILKAKYAELVQRIEAIEGQSADEAEPEKTIMERPIEVLDLSVRSYNCLKRAKCNIIADVVELEKSGKMPQVRNLGLRSAEEIRQKLEGLGL